MNSRGWRKRFVKSSQTRIGSFVSSIVLATLYTTNQLERLAKEAKRRTKVVDSFGGVVGKPLQLMLRGLSERLEGRRLPGFYGSVDEELSC